MMPNSPLKKQPREALPPNMQAAFDAAHELHGDTTFVSVFGNAPAVYDWYIERFYKELFYSGRVPREVVELVRLRLANIHGCAFCNRSDTLAALSAGVTQEQVDALADYETGPFTGQERAALALAETMALTNPRGVVTPELHQRLTAHFSEGHVVELGVIVAVLCGMAKMIFAYDLVEKSDSCPL